MHKMNCRKERKTTSTRCAEATTTAQHRAVSDKLTQSRAWTQLQRILKSPKHNLNHHESPPAHARTKHVNLSNTVMFSCPDLPPSHAHEDYFFSLSSQRFEPRSSLQMWWMMPDFFSNSGCLGKKLAYIARLSSTASERQCHVRSSENPSTFKKVWDECCPKDSADVLGKRLNISLNGGSAALRGTQVIQISACGRICGNVWESMV